MQEEYKKKIIKNKIVSIIILVDAERRFLDESMSIFKSIPRKSLDSFEIITVEFEKPIKERVGILEGYLEELPNLKVVKYSEENKTRSKAFARGINFANGEYIKLIRNNDFLVKESFTIFLSILKIKTPDILYSNCLLFNNDNKQLYPIDQFMKNYTEGPTKVLGKTYFPSLYLITFRKSLISDINLNEIPDSFWTYRFIALTAISKATMFYTTRSFTYAIRTYADRKSVYSSTTNLRNTKNLEAVLKLIKRIDLNNPKSEKFTRKYLSLYIRNYLASINVRKDDNWKIHYKQISQELYLNTTIKSPRLLSFQFETLWGMSPRFKNKKPETPILADKIHGKVDFT